MGCYGEPYRFEVNSTDATTPVAISIFDSDGTERTLADNEYVRLESMNIYIANAVDRLDFFDDVNDNNTVNDGERLATAGTNTNGDDAETHDVQFGGEGKRLSIGRKPKIVAAAAGQVTVTGVCYIHEGTTEQGRPSYRQQFGQ